MRNYRFRIGLMIVATTMLLTGCGTIGTKSAGGWRYYDQDGGQVIGEERIKELLYGRCANPGSPNASGTSCQPSGESFIALYGKSAANPDNEADAAKMVRSGIVVGELLCDQFFAAIKEAVNVNSNVRGQTNLVGGLTNTLLGIGKANSAISNSIAAGFSFAGASMETYNAAMLFAPDPVKVRDLVRKAHDAVREQIVTTSPPGNFHDAIRGLNSFLYQCHLVGINELVQKAVASGKPGLEFDTTARTAFAMLAISTEVVRLAPVFDESTLNDTELRDLYWSQVEGLRGVRETMFVGRELSRLSKPPLVQDSPENWASASKDVLKDLDAAVKTVANVSDFPKGAKPEKFRPDESLKARLAEIQSSLRKIDDSMKLKEKVAAARTTLQNKWAAFDDSYAAALGATKEVLDATGPGCIKGDPKEEAVKMAAGKLRARHKSLTDQLSAMDAPPADLVKYAVVNSLLEKLPVDADISEASISKTCATPSGIFITGSPQATVGAAPVTVMNADRNFKRIPISPATNQSYNIIMK